MLHCLSNDTIAADLTLEASGSSLKPWDYDLCTVVVDLDVIFIGTVREFYFYLFCLGLSTI